MDPSPTAPQGLELVPAEGREGLAAIASLLAETQPEMALTVDELVHEDTLAPEGRRWLAVLDGAVVGGCVSSRFYARPPDFEGAWTTLMVREPHRRRGIGSALLARNAEHARALGKRAMFVYTTEARPEGIAFLQHRGFVERERATFVELPLAGLEPPAVAPPEGIAVTTLAERPELGAGIYGAALEAEVDVPTADPHELEPYERWRQYAIDMPEQLHEACFVALAGDDVVGWANLGLPGARPGVAYHCMTGVKRAWRGRGVAGALKRATIAWAVTSGLDVLETENDEGNAPMRAVNARLGYRPTPDRVLLRGELPAG
jgi:GNAT superfamily N-acetyltransferase